MPFVGVLGIWAFVIVCATIAVVTLVLKVQYERQQKQSPSEPPVRKPDDTDIITK